MWQAAILPFMPWVWTAVFNQFCGAVDGAMGDGALIPAFFPTLKIPALALRAFAFHSMLQCQFAGPIFKKLFFGLIAGVLLFITLFAVPAG